MYKSLNSKLSKNIDFIIIDLACLQVSFIISYIYRHGLSLPYNNTIYLRIGLLLVIFHICIVFITDCYSGILRRTKFDEFKTIIKYNCILLAVVLAYMFLIKQSSAYSRQMFIIFWGLSNIIMYIAHNLEKYYVNSLANNENFGEHLLIISKKDLVEECTKKFISNGKNYIKLIGIVIIDENMIGSEVSGVPVVANYDSMIEYARTNVVDQVMINTFDSKVEGIAKKLMEMGITLHINIDSITSNILNAEVQKVNGTNVLTTSINIVTPRQLFIKRLISIVLAIFGIIATAVAFVIFAPIIYIQSPGPIFFSQERVGKNGRRFRIYKFRSMYMDSEELKKDLIDKNKINGLMFKIADDPRVTPIGKFLRASSIDEFPQFWNILKGDMSLVGTRPPTVEEYEQYALHHKQRLSTKPGLTGMWQVSGRSNITDFEEVVKLDTEYIKNWSLGLDMKIILKTVGVVLSRKGSI